MITITFRVGHDGLGDVHVERFTRAAAINYFSFPPVFPSHWDVLSVEWEGTKNVARTDWCEITESYIDEECF